MPKILENFALSLDDVLIVPKYSEIESRKNVKVNVEFITNSRTWNFSNPIIPANMKSICGLNLIKEVWLSGGLVFLHRFDTYENQELILKELLSYYNEFGQELDHPFEHVGVSLGIKKEDKENAEKFYNLGVRLFCLDIAHAHSKESGKMCKFLKKKFNDILLVAGNVATGEGAKFLWDNGADVVKVNVGSGSICTTRINTGAGVPTITALESVYNESLNYKDKYFIADGGIKNSGDVTKCLAFADMVMAGNIFAGCEETPDETVMIDGKLYKKYAGSSTHKSENIEGVVGYVLVKGKYYEVNDTLLQGLKSGCSYVGAWSIKELKDKVEFVKITGAGIRESNAHDVRLL